MPSRHPALVSAALSLLAASVLPAPAQSEEFHCRRGDLVRQIEVQFADDADRLPCQVVYRKESERPGRPRIPWNAQHELEFCTQKAREMVERLQSSGWSCDGGSPPSEDAAELNARTTSEEAARGPEEAARAPAVMDTPALSPDRPPPNGGPPPDRAILQAALARDIRRLDELSGDASWGFEPDMATLGDLDGDGMEDAAVLLNYRDQNGAASHHLLAYLFDGETFQPVARINVEAYYKNLTDVAIREIADGGIELLLHMTPAGRRHATFKLRDGQLVLAAESEPGA